jgi:hypothetical protein
VRTALSRAAHLVRCKLVDLSLTPPLGSAASDCEGEIRSRFVTDREFQLAGSEASDLDPPVARGKDLDAGFRRHQMFLRPRFQEHPYRASGRVVDRAQNEPFVDSRILLHDQRLRPVRS